MEHIPRSEKFNGSLTSEEEAFVTDYARRLDAILDRVSARHGFEARALLMEIARPDAWRILLRLGKAERLMSRVDQNTSANPLAKGDGVSDDYEQKAEKVVTAISELSEALARIK